MPDPTCDAVFHEDSVQAIIATYGDKAIDHILVSISEAVRRSDDGAVTSLDRLLRRLETLDLDPPQNITR